MPASPSPCPCVPRALSGNGARYAQPPGRGGVSSARRSFARSRMRKECAPHLRTTHMRTTHMRTAVAAHTTRSSATRSRAMSSGGRCSLGRTRALRRLRMRCHCLHHRVRTQRVWRLQVRVRAALSEAVPYFAAIHFRIVECSSQMPSGSEPHTHTHTHRSICNGRSAVLLGHAVCPDM